MWDIFIHIPNRGRKPKPLKGKAKGYRAYGDGVYNKEYAILHEGDRIFEYEDANWLFDAGYQYDGYQRINGILYHHFTVCDP